MAISAAIAVIAVAYPRLVIGENKYRKTPKVDIAD
jgi:hypothetical protein